MHSTNEKDNDALNNLDDEELNNYLVKLGDAIFDEENRPAMVDPVRLYQISYIYSLIKSSIKDKSVAVECVFNKPFVSMAYISICGENIIFKNTNCFSSIAQYASNIEMYPKTDGKTQINITFHGLTGHFKDQEE